MAGLGNVALGPFDEGIVARISLELSQSEWPDGLFPSLWGLPYLNKPPGLHWLIALTIRTWRITTSADTAALPPEWVVRLAPALLSTLIVPVAGLLQHQLLPGLPLASVGASVILLTLMPVAAHGRVAMLDGAQLSAMYGCWFFLACSSGPSLKGKLSTFLAGLCCSSLLLMKAPAALPVLVIGLLLLSSDSALKTSFWPQIFLPLILGLLPGLAWHIASWMHHGPLSFVMWWQEGYARGAALASEYQGSWTFLPLEFIRGSLPWLPLWPLGLIDAVYSLPSRWSRWSLGLTGATVMMSLAVRPHKVWYSVLVWPAFALICGMILARIFSPGQANQRLRRIVGFFWILTGIAVLCDLCLDGQLFSGSLLAGYRDAFIALAFAMMITGVMLCCGSLRPTRIAVLGLVGFWSVSLLSVFLTPDWHPWSAGEKNRRYAEQLRTVLIQNGCPRPIYSDHYDYIRNWYLNAGVRLLPGSSTPLPDSFIVLVVDRKASNTMLANQRINCQTKAVISRPTLTISGGGGAQPLFVQVCQRRETQGE